MDLKIISFATRNIFRQRARSIMTLLSITLGVAGLIFAGGFVQDIYIMLGESFIHSQTGHIQIFKRDFLAKGTRRPDKFLIENASQIAQQIQRMPGVESVNARLNFTALLNNGHKDLGVIGEGVEPDKEARLGSMLKMISGKPLSDRDQFGIAVGQGVAHSLGLEPGSRVTLVMNTAGGAINSLDFEVIGIFQSFSKDYDARAIRIPLAAAQELMQMQATNLLVVALKKTEQTDQIYSRIKALLDGKTYELRRWQDLSDFYSKAVQLYERQFGVLQLIILFMVLLSVINSVNMSTFERTAEVGTLQALGNRPRDVFALLMIEGTILGVLGASVGLLVGVLAAWGVSQVGIPMPPPPNSNVGYLAHVQIVPFVVVRAWLIGLCACVFASVLPARRAIRVPLAEALRQSI